MSGRVVVIKYPQTLIVFSAPWFFPSARLGAQLVVVLGILFFAPSFLGSTIGKIQLHLYVCLSSSEF
jgi:hypothetical protein